MVRLVVFWNAKGDTRLRGAVVRHSSGVSPGWVGREDDMTYGSPLIDRGNLSATC